MPWGTADPIQCPLERWHSAMEFMLTCAVPTRLVVPKDVVYIGTIHPMHKEQTMLCLKAGKHVLVEKPIALNAADAAEMVAFARAKGTCSTFCRLSRVC